MAKLPRNISALVEARKELGRSPSWDELSDGRYAFFTTPLTFAEDMTETGLQVRVKVSRRFIDRDAAIQLEYRPAGRRSIEPLWRIEWRPIGVHQNGDCPPDLAMARLTGTHQHRFDDNYLEGENRMRSNNLPAARPIEAEIGSLSKFIEFSGDLFNIVDVERIFLPEFPGDLFGI